MGAKKRCDAIVLFSGGLDSILAAKVLEEQNLSLRCLHFITPFFGFPEACGEWRSRYGLDVEIVDISREFISLLKEGPRHGFGKHLNPCIDCKILMLRKAREKMEAEGASFIASGEVVGQRPMSQRKDALNLISREAGVRGLLLRPLCAGCLPPTPMEENGTVSRDHLAGVSGRGRKIQYELAEKYGIQDIPAPGGGCLLTQQENVRSYWPLLERNGECSPEDFVLANAGRQFWHDGYWLCIGRNRQENEELLRLATETDIVFKTAMFPGPVGVGRMRDGPWPEAVIEAAAAFVASFSSRAVLFHQETGEPVNVRVERGKGSICAVFSESAASASRCVRMLPVVPHRGKANEGTAGIAWKQEEYASLRERIRKHGEKRRQKASDGCAPVRD